MFWMCMNRDHADTGTVTWEGEVARCGVCGLTSDMTRRWLTLVREDERQRVVHYLAGLAALDAEGYAVDLVAFLSRNEMRGHPSLLGTLEALAHEVGEGKHGHPPAAEAVTLPLGDVRAVLEVAAQFLELDVSDEFFPGEENRERWRALERLQARVAEESSRRR
jgi:hypothetical protein